MEKAKDQQDIEFNSISSAAYYKPAILPVNIIDSENENENITNSYGFYESVNPK